MRGCPTYNCNNMKKEPYLKLYMVQFAAFSRNERRKVGKKRCGLPFDLRRDLLFEDDTEGVVAKVTFENERFGYEPARGVRTTVRFTLIDYDARIAVWSEVRNVYVPKDEYWGEYYLCFNLSEIPLRAGHTYRLVVHDMKKDVTMGECSMHVYAESELGDPGTWYDVCDGGIRPAWEKDVRQSVNVIPSKDYWIRFGLSQEFGARVPDILPELEMRLYNVETGEVKVNFMEPRCLNFSDNLYFVEQPFVPTYDDVGLFYAELLCMQCPIAGFVFDTSLDGSTMAWYGFMLDPLEEFSPEEARKRADLWLYPEGKHDEDDPLMKEIDKFIADELEESPAEDESTPEEVADDSSGEETAEEETPRPSLAEALGHLTGLHTVKEKLLAYENVVRFNRLRADSGLPAISMPLHSMFLGSPGTGKTTVAKMLGEMLRDAGVLSSGHVVVKERAILLGQNYNSESEKTLEAIEAAQGGILLIDEAYQLYQPSDPRDPGRLVIETLLTSLADEKRRDWMLILAGYPEPMMKLMDMNPGFKSRIPESNIYHFDDFSEPELMEIARNYLSSSQYCLTPEADEALADRLKADYDGRDKNFGNARHVINLIQTEILPAMARRIISRNTPGGADLTSVLAADIPAACRRTAPVRPRVGFR